MDPLAVRTLEAARLVGISRSQMVKLIGSGEIKSFTVGTSRLILVEDLRIWMEKQTNRTVR